MITRSWHLRSRQRVHNTLHHLEDCSLPHEQWNHEAELAAIVSLLRRNSTLVAAQTFTNLVRRFVQSYRQIGVEIEPFDEQQAFKSVQDVAEFRDTLPDDYSDADIYAAVLARDSREAA